MSYIEKCDIKPFFRTFIVVFRLLLANPYAQLWFLSNPAVMLSDCLSDICDNKNCEASAFCTYGY